MKDQIKSKINFLWLAFWVFSIFFLLFLAFKSTVYITKKDNEIDVLRIILTIILYVLPIYIFYYLNSNFPSFKINSKGITITSLIKNRFISWQEIKSIKIIDKKVNHFLIFPFEYDCITVYFNDNSKIYIWRYFYKNTPDLRVILNRANHFIKSHKLISNLDFKIERTKLLNTNFSYSKPSTYNGNHFLSFYGIIMYGWVLFLLTMIIIQPDVIIPELSNKIAALFSVIVIVSFSGYEMNFFKISDNHILVENTIFFWRKHVFPIDKIKEIIVQREYKKSIGLKIITEDFNDYNYRSGNLDTESWLKLINHLNEKQIKVTDYVFLSSNSEE